MDINTFSAMTDADKGLWGSIIGATVGAFFGAIGAYIIGLTVERRTKKREHQKQQDQKLKEYSGSIFGAESSLQMQLPSLYKNVRLLRQCADKIGSGELMATLPRRVELDKNLSIGFRNIELVNEWLTLCTRLEMVNQLIEDFRAYYNRANGEVYSALLHGESEKLNIKLVRTEREMLERFARSTQRSTEVVIENILSVAALISVHAILGNDERTRFKSFEIMNQYTVPPRRRSEELAELRKKFNPDTLFEDMN